VEGVVAVFGVGTLPAHRRRGLGRAVTLAVLHEGRRRGADLAYLNPTDSGEPVYRALGFTDAPGWAVWTPREP
jgi:predicted acetyltransferase